MLDEVSLLALAASLISFLCTIFFGTMNYKDYYHQRFNFLQMFPYEMGNQPKMKITNFFRFVLALFSVSAAILQIHLLSTVFVAAHYMTMIIGTLTVITLASLFIIPMENAKVHMSFFSISYSLNILTYASFAYYIKTTPLYIKGLDIYFWISILLIVFQVCLLFSPKLTKWYVLEEREENGKVIYVRPKVIYLALIEWLSLILYWIYLVLLVLSRAF